MKLTKKRLSKLIREERSSSRMYRKYGLGSIAKDETRHARKLSKMRRGYL